MNVFLLTESFSSQSFRFKGWRMQTLPAIVSLKVPDMIFWIGKWRMLMEAKLVKMIQ